MPDPPGGDDSGRHGLSESLGGRRASTRDARRWSSRRMRRRAAYGGTPSDQKRDGGDRRDQGARAEGDALSFHHDGHGGGQRAARPLWRQPVAAGLSVARAHHRRSGAAVPGTRRPHARLPGRRSNAFCGKAQPGQISRRVGGRDRFLAASGGLGLPPVRAAPCAAGGGRRRRRRVPDRPRAARADDAARRERRFPVRRGAVRAGRRVRAHARPGDEDHLRRRLERVFRPSSGWTAPATSISISTRCGRIRRSTRSASTTTCRSPTGATRTMRRQSGWVRRAYDPAGLRARSPAAKGSTGTIRLADGASGARARGDHRRCFRQAMGVPLQGSRGAGGRTRIRPRGRRARPASRRHGCRAASRSG